MPVEAGRRLWLLLALAGCGVHETGDWRSNGRDPLEQRYSPLDQIDTGNVARLGLAWYYEFDTDRGQEATPLVVDGVLYVSTAWSKVFAFDGESGKLLWRFDPQVPRETLAIACCDAVNRGVAFANGQIFVGTLDGRLIALDAKTGAVRRSVDTRDPARPGASYTITGAPRIAGGNVVIGNGGAEFGVRGYVTAYDLKTGRLAWRFYTVPNGQGRADGAASDEVLRAKAAGTWGEGVWRRSGGGGAVWDSLTYDPASNALYIGVGNGGPYDRFWRAGDKGDNLFLSSIVAVDADSGRYRWHYQTTPGDSWDYTATQQMIGADIAIDGKPRAVLMQAPKNGFFYVLDRQTGRLISAKPYVPVSWAKGVDPRSGRPIEAPGAHYQDSPAILQPGPMGGHSWQAMAFSPRTGLVYIPAQLITSAFEKDPAFRQRPQGMNVAITMRNFPEGKDALAAARAATRGRLLAWDPVRQKAAWWVDRPSYSNGGTLATAGDLVFQGTAEGRFEAFDARNGRLLWSAATGNGIIAPPISYRVRGAQYVAVMIGYGGLGPLIGKIVPDGARRAGRLAVFRLDGKARFSSYPQIARAPIVRDATSAGDANAGAAEYARTCSVCHGANASVAYTADLRRSAALSSPEAWNDVVIGGVLKDQGMIGFGRILSDAQAENIRAYVIDQARKSDPAD